MNVIHFNKVFSFLKENHGSAGTRGQQNVSFVSDLADPVQPPAYSEAVGSQNNPPPTYEEATQSSAVSPTNAEIAS